MNLATVTEVVDPENENTTLPPPFARLDPDTGIFTYSPGESVDTVFPCKYNFTNLFSCTM